VSIKWPPKRASKWTWKANRAEDAAGEERRPAVEAAEVARRLEEDLAAAEHRLAADQPEVEREERQRPLAAAEAHAAAPRPEVVAAHQLVAEIPEAKPDEAEAAAARRLANSEGIYFRFASPRSGI